MRRARRRAWNNRPRRCAWCRAWHDGNKYLCFACAEIARRIEADGRYGCHQAVAGQAERVDQYRARADQGRPIFEGGS
jgi:hypothetical protein